MVSRNIVSTLITLIVILAWCDKGVASDDTGHYVAVKNQQNVMMCSNATVPDKTIKMVRSLILCSGKCSSEERCVGFNFRKKKRLCELFNHQRPTKFDVEEGVLVFRGMTVNILFYRTAPTISRDSHQNNSLHTLAYLKIVLFILQRIRKLQRENYIIPRMCVCVCVFWWEPARLIYGANNYNTTRVSLIPNSLTTATIATASFQ